MASHSLSNLKLVAIMIALDPMIAGPEGGPLSDMQRFED